MHADILHMKHMLNRELDELYVSMAIRAFALSVVGIFVPIYLLQIGLSVYSVILYYLVYVVTRFFFAAPAARLAARHGLKKMMFLSNALMAVYFVALRFANDVGIDVNYLAVLAGVAVTLFWTSYHIDFVKFSKKKYTGEELSMSNMLVSVSSFLGPFIGGASILIFGFNPVLIVAVILLVLSMLPLFFSKDTHDPYTFSMKNVIAGRPGREYAGHIGFGIEAFAGIFWVLIIFLTITDNLASLGFVASISLAFSLILSYISGKYSSKNPFRVLKIGAIALTLIWSIRLLVKDFFQLLVSDSLYGSSRPATDISYDTVTYQKARKKTAEYIVFREMMIPLGGIIIMSLLLLINDINYSIYFAIIGSLLLIAFRK